MAHVKGMSTNNVDPYAEFKGTKNKGNFDYGNRDRHVPPLAYKFIEWFGKLPQLPSDPLWHIVDFLTTDLGLEWMENLGMAPLHDGLGHSRNLLKMIMKVVDADAHARIVKNIEAFIKRQGTIKFFCETDYRHIFMMYDKIFEGIGLSSMMMAMLLCWARIFDHAGYSELDRTPKTVYRMFVLIYLHFCYLDVLFKKQAPVRKDFSGKEPLYGSYAHRIMVHWARAFCLLALSHVNEQRKEQQFKYLKFIASHHTNGHGGLSLAHYVFKEGKERWNSRHGKRCGAKKREYKDRRTAAQWWRLTHTYERIVIPPQFCKPTDDRWIA
jgi:hypothetical protein